jgi:DNA-binding transcriptional MerR regulator
VGYNEVSHEKTKERRIMSMQRLEDNTYDAKTVMKILGIDKDKLQYWVRIGLLERINIGGKLAHGLYNKKQVDALARRIEAVILSLEVSKEVFRLATLDDLLAENALAAINFGTGPNTPINNAARRAFLLKNPEITYHLYDNNILCGVINIVPLRAHCIPEFREGKRGWLFNPEDIEQFEPGHPLNLIIINFMTTPSVPPVRRSAYAVRMLTELSTVFAAWGRRGVEIATVHASGGTPMGRRILESAGFTLVGDRGNDRVIYELNVASSNLKLLEDYRLALAEYKAMQEG